MMTGNFQKLRIRIRSSKESKRQQPARQEQGRGCAVLRQVKKLLSRLPGKHTQPTSCWEMPVQGKSRIALKFSVEGSVLNVFCTETFILSLQTKIPLT